MTPKEFTRAKFAFYTAIVEDRALADLDRRVAWLLLAKYLNAEKMASWPAAQTLADDLGVSLRAVRNSTNRLAVKGWFNVRRSRGRHSNHYSPNWETVKQAAPLTMKPSAPLTVQSGVTNGADQRHPTVKQTAPDTLEEPFKEPFRTARFATPDGDAHGATLKSKKVCSAMKGARLENALYYRRQELESRGHLRYATLSNLEREAADEWLKDHGEIGGSTPL